MAGQTYMHGLIQIAPDEAMIIEFEPPVDSPYWGVQILDYFMDTAAGTTGAFPGLVANPHRSSSKRHIQRDSRGVT
jgi:hypothetical protein